MAYLQIYKNNSKASYTHTVLKGDELYVVNIIPGEKMFWKYLGKVGKDYTIDGTLIHKPSLKMISIIQNKLKPKTNEGFTFIRYKDWLNEGHIDDLEPEEIVTNKYVDIQLNDSFMVELMIATYKDETNHGDLSDDEVLASPDFKEYVKYEFESKFYETRTMLKEFIEDGRIDIWRSLRVSGDWFEHFLKEGKHLGIYWSFSSKAAEPHWGYNDEKKNVDVLIKSSVKEEYVDWVKTLRLNISQTSEEEKEIRLFKNTPIKIEELYINKKMIDITKLKEKTFKA